jgi:Ca2+-binding RTX toxin-like protein
MPLPTWTNAQVTAQLDSGEKWANATITYAFPTTTAGLTADFGETATFTAFVASQVSKATIAIGLWDDIIAPDMVLTTASTSNIEFANGSDPSYTEYAFAYYPLDPPPPSQTNGGTVWLNREFDGSGLGDPTNDANNNLVNPTIGLHGFATYVHEVGHAFGLNHSGDYSAVNYPPSNFRDSTVYSIMSYFGPSWGSGPEAGEGEVAWADWVGSDGFLYEPQTPMIDDVLVMQAMYGAELSTRTTNTTYGFNSSLAGQYEGLYDFTQNINPIMCFVDSGGIDTLDVSGWTSQSIINLTAGEFSSANSMTNNLSIAYGVVIENASTGGGDDTLNGNDVANVLSGGAGTDTLNGGAGNDTLIGGAGGDFLNGGADNDTASYAGSTVGVTVDLNLGGPQVSTGDASGDGFSSIENLTGSSFVDTLTGNAFGNILNGGVDAVVDTLIGGDGDDIYVMNNAVADNVTETGAFGTDTLQSSLTRSLAGFTGIENLTLTGTAAADGTGNALANVITGNDGANVLTGGGGNDTIIGGIGTDTAAFAGNMNQYVVLFNSATQTHTFYGNDGSIDTTTGVENFQFADGTRTTAQLTIVPTAPVRTASVSAVTVSANEGNSGTTPFTFTITLNAAAYSPLTVNWATAGTGANPASLGDFSGIFSGVETFAIGELTKTVTVNVLGDTLVEPDETFAVTLTSPSAGLVLGTASATATIVNDDSVAPVAGSVAINDVTVTEGDAGTVNATFTVTRTSGTAAFSVNYATSDGTATAGSDYIAATGTLNFAAGETTKTFTVAVNGDTVFEPNETFIATLSAATNGAAISDATGQGTITNDDAAPVAGSVAINDVTVTEGNAGTVNATFTVTRTSGTAAFSVNYATSDGTATAGSDYIAATGTLNFAAGETTKTFTVAVNGDTVFEPNETFIATLSAATNGAAISDATGQGTITNDDAAPVVTISDVTITEGNSGTQNAIFTISRSGGVGAFAINYATTNGSATAGSDYVAATGTLNFAEGVNTQTFTVVVNGDTVFEPNESFTATLSGATNGATISDATGQATITNDDPNIINGDAFNNNLSGTAGVDIINGLGGDDVLTGGAGGDTLDGGAGTGDTADYGSSALGVTVDLNLAGPQVSTGDASGDVLINIEYLTGSNLDDILTGNSGNNVLTGRAGNDTLNGGLGNDELIGGAGADTLNGGDGADSAYYAASVAGVTVNLNLAGAQVSGGDAAGDILSGIEYVYGSSADGDTLTGNSGANFLAGLGGNDILDAGGGTDTVDGGAGNDWIEARSGIDSFNGGANTDTLSYYYSATAVNVALADTGNAVVSGEAAGDTITNIENLYGSNAGGDNLKGNSAVNYITGMAGNDILDGAAGNDVLVGGDGSDWLEAGTGTDTFDGSGGTDTLSYYFSALGVNINLATGAASGGEAAGDTITNVEYLYGSSTGGDILTGNAATNYFVGNGGADTLNGGLGNDWMVGGDGADTFRFDTALGAANVDQITDFNVIDTIQLENSVFTGFAVGAIAAANLSLTGAAVGTAAQVIYTSTTGTLAYDADGTGAAASTTFANIGAGKTLTVSDFDVT